MDIFVPMSGRVRLVPVRFTRAGGGSAEIAANRPDIDDRGHLDPTFAAHAGVAVGSTSDIEVVRVGVPDNLSLYATASNDSFEIASSNPLPSSTRATVQIRGRDGAAESRTGTLDIRAERADGPIVGRLFIEVFVVRRVDLTFHRVTFVHGTQIDTVGPPDMDLDAVGGVARDAWIHYGVDLHWEVVQSQFRVNHQWYLNMPANSEGEGPRLLDDWEDNHTCHVHVVWRINSDASTEGVGISRASMRRFGYRRPGIILSQAEASSRSVGAVGNNLAHELGHFFGNWHAGLREPPAVISSSFGTRNLMHNFEPALGPNNWARAHDGRGDSVTRPRRSNHGYGDLRRGALVTMKTVPGIDNDDQVHRVRRLLGQPNGAY